MQVDEIIKVLQHYKNGGKVKIRPVGLNCESLPINFPDWNFKDYDYIVEGVASREVTRFPMPDDWDGRYQGTGGNFTCGSTYEPYDENGKATKDALLERDPEGMGNGNSFIGKIDVS